MAFSERPPRAAGKLQPTLTYGVGGNIPVFDVYFNAGNSCLNVPPADKVQYDATVDCTKEEHRAEVFMEYKTGMRNGDKDKNIPPAGYPADEALNRYAESSCAMFYNSNEVLKSGKTMNVMAVIPSKEAWDSEKSPQRSIYCIAWPADNSTMTGSIVPDEPS
ncbi:hypothetical protein [Kibdelosporangium aridum]|uniref:hypothetical protein n=1 Tax=Kibdelosporangium aridum TaxID=2030 RepID=UPI0035E759B8